MILTKLEKIIVKKTVKGTRKLIFIFFFIDISSFILIIFFEVWRKIN